MRSRRISSFSEKYVWLWTKSGWNIMAYMITILWITFMTNKQNYKPFQSLDSFRYKSRMESDWVGLIINGFKTNEIQNNFWIGSGWFALARIQISEWFGIVLIGSEWIPIRNFRQGYFGKKLSFYLNLLIYIEETLEEVAIYQELQLIHRITRKTLLSLVGIKSR